MLSREDILQIQQLVRHVVVAEDVARYAVRLSAATRPTQPDVPDFVKKYVKWGAGLRASQALVLGAKARALTLGRAYVTPDDIRTLAAPGVPSPRADQLPGRVRGAHHRRCRGETARADHATCQRAV